MPDPLTDLPLELYAAVIAALGEGYSLGEILEHEGLSEDVWEASEEVWIERLGDSAEGDLSLCDEFDRALSAQRARFGRRVPPLDSDIDAFIAFQRLLAAEQKPLVWLAQHGLYLGDWIRLQEYWAERLSQDAAARARVAALLSSPEPPHLTRVEPGPRTLPAPLRERPTPATSMTFGEPVPGELIEWGLDLIRGDRPAHRAKAPLPPAPMEVPFDEGAEVLPRAVEAVARPSFMQEQAQIPALRALLAPLVEVEQWSAGELTLVPLSQPVSRSALPFAAEDESSAGELTLVPLSQPVSRPALPFAAEDESSAGELTLVPLSPPVPRPALPVAKDASATTRDMIKSDLIDVNQTLPPAPLVLAARSVLPFEPDAPTSHPLDVTTGASPDTGYTLPPAPLVALDRPDLPFAKNAAAPPATGPSVKLTIEQYAALCAELAVMPTPSEAVFLRYGLTSPRERLTIDLAWQDRLRRNPTEHQAWAVLYERYRARFALRLKGGNRD